MFSSHFGWIGGLSLLPYNVLLHFLYFFLTGNKWAGYNRGIKNPSCPVCRALTDSFHRVCAVDLNKCTHSALWDNQLWRLCSLKCYGKTCWACRPSNASWILEGSLANWHRLLRLGKTLQKTIRSNPARFRLVLNAWAECYTQANRRNEV